MCIHVFNPGFSEKQSEFPSGMWGMATAVGTLVGARRALSCSPGHREQVQCSLDLG